MSKEELEALVEALEIEIRMLARENENMAEYLLCTGLLQDKIDKICRGNC